MRDPNVSHRTEATTTEANGKHQADHPTATPTTERRPPKDTEVYIGPQHASQATDDDKSIPLRGLGGGYGSVGIRLGHQNGVGRAYG